MCIEDIDARTSMWEVIRVAAGNVRRSWGVQIFLELDTDKEIIDLHEAPDLKLWKLFEIVSVLAVLTGAQYVSTKKITNLKGKAGPIEYTKDERQLYLWTQPRMTGEESGLGGIPDIVITTTRKEPSPNNAIHIIEVKRSKSLNTKDIRAEFAKAVDLRVRSYFIWSFYSPTEKLIQGAKNLRIELTATGFDTVARNNLLDPHKFLHFVSQNIEGSFTAGRLAYYLEEVADEAKRKGRNLVISSATRD